GKGEIDPGLMGIGVPILREDGDLAGSLTTILPLHELSPIALERVVLKTQRAAAEISSLITTHRHPDPSLVVRVADADVPTKKARAHNQSKPKRRSSLKI
ncbi:MAG: hypothetical protein Q7S51_06735, partial [Gallionellaceae bacterium]|nr:hypothetical protein [Gallionellaceae bacterium]